MTERGIEGMWDSTGRKKILDQSDLKMFEEWLYMDPVMYDFQSASWNMDMIVTMFGRIHGACRCTKRTSAKGNEADGILILKTKADTMPISIS